MKRSYDDMVSSLTTLPVPDGDDPKLFKACLNGIHRLAVTKVVDISKPIDRQSEEIETDENDDDNKQSRSNVRMLQLYLKDLNGVEIKAIETEFLEALTTIKADHVICISGAVEIRCGNIMLSKKNLTNVIVPPKLETPQLVDEIRHHKELQGDPGVTADSSRQEAPQVANLVEEDRKQLQNIPTNKEEIKQEVVLIEDWDEDDEDDCIILD